MKNNIIKKPINQLGYNFIDAPYIPDGKDEYYLRNTQNRSGIEYRQLTAFEIEALVRNRNTSDNWNKILVSDLFNPELVKNCKFFGLVRIGQLENVCLDFSDLSMPVGLYNSTIISCDFGDNVVVNDVHYMSHVIVGDEVILSNINELVTSNHSKFGNGIVKDGEDESVRIWLEICNENGGRKVLPFNSMLSGDAWLWSKYRDHAELLEKFKIFTEKEFKTKNGYYGKIGDRTVIKNTAIIKDVWIGSDAYIKGASKIKNVTINSGEEGISQIGEGCEIVNGIIGFGCRIFYGVKAIRFVMGNHSQLKYGARLINSYLGSNSTISCCEVLNSLIFPGHEQHHNNSFLCAALVMGQSNIPAGATIGSNHNSRSADGEFIAKRGFWPALCSNIKHNSKFPTFTMLARGNYAYDLDIKIPFSLVSVNESENRLDIMVGYWFLYNMYALTRNAWKAGDRDARIQKPLLLEFDYLAPDSVNEIIVALGIIENAVGEAYLLKYPNESKENNSSKIGKQLLSEGNSVIDELEICLKNVEHSNRKVLLTKVRKGYDVFREMLYYYSLNELYRYFVIENHSLDTIYQWEIVGNMHDWLNVGGQLMTQNSVSELIGKIENEKIQSWDDVHHFYQKQAAIYPKQKLSLALVILKDYFSSDYPNWIEKDLSRFFEDFIAIESKINQAVIQSRQKDYELSFRKMMYDNQQEMDEVLGAFDKNAFILQKKDELEVIKQKLVKFHQNSEC
ncbi:DUF4954 family protein [Rhizosphaericola mali]|uniref:DUF4954 family protein n=1 Tax=Rhizosphaericola mali TaxID=2545455 RepID=A0A5P2FZR3_9BACT|nr:DUF4954 family protein [Rhizosphaericola mali]QES87898.1 DUF4954 family protein [Rhizosphaericola mali]